MMMMIITMPMPKLKLKLMLMLMKGGRGELQPLWARGSLAGESAQQQHEGGEGVTANVGWVAKGSRGKTMGAEFLNRRCFSSEVTVYGRGQGKGRQAWRVHEDCGRLGRHTHTRTYGHTYMQSIRSRSRVVEDEG